MADARVQFSTWSILNRNLIPQLVSGGTHGLNGLRRDPPLQTHQQSPGPAGFRCSPEGEADGWGGETRFGPAILRMMAVAAGDFPMRTQARPFNRLRYSHATVRLSNTTALQPAHGALLTKAIISTGPGNFHGRDCLSSRSPDPEL